MIKLLNRSLRVSSLGSLKIKIQMTTSHSPICISCIHERRRSIHWQINDSFIFVFNLDRHNWITSYAMNRHCTARSCDSYSICVEIMMKLGFSGKTRVCPVNSEKIYIYLETLCGTSFTSCSVRRRNARDHVEWHSNRKNQKQLKISGDIRELVPKRQQSFTTNICLVHSLWIYFNRFIQRACGARFLHLVKYFNDLIIKLAEK